MRRPDFCINAGLAKDAYERLPFTTKTPHNNLKKKSTTVNTAIIEFPLEHSESTRESVNAETACCHPPVSGTESNPATAPHSPWSIRAAFPATLFVLLAFWSALSLDEMAWHFVQRDQIRPLSEWLSDFGTTMLNISTVIATIAAAASVRLNQLKQQVTVA